MAKTAEAVRSRRGVRFHLRSLETGVLYDDCIPEKVIQAAMAIPKSSFTLCPDPDMQLWDSLRGGFFDTQQRNMEAGLPPIPPAIFVRTHSPARYWYGRVLYIPDKNHQLHYVLLALETDSFYGYGLFFEFRGVLLVILAVLGVSCLWWWPFVRHLSRPLLKMVHYAERVEMDNFVCLDKALSDTRTFSGERRDEIGRLGHAFMTMTRRVGLLISGQSQFIRHIAHELNSPLARTQIGLAILEERLEGNPKARVQRIMQDINRLSMLTDEVLSYLQAKASLGTPKNERIYLCPFLSSIVRSEAPEADVNVFAGQGRVAVDGQGLPAPGGVQRAAQRHHLRGGGGAHRRGSGRGAWGSAHFGPRQGAGRARTGFAPAAGALLPGQGVPDASRRLGARPVHRQILHGSMWRAARIRERRTVGILRFPVFPPRAKVPCSVKCAGSRTAPSYSVSPSPGTLRIKDSGKGQKSLKEEGGEGGRRGLSPESPLLPLLIFLPRSPSGPKRL